LAESIVIPESIIKLINDLPKNIRIKFWEKLELLLRNPAHPSLRNEKLRGTEYRAFSITMNYRATYFRDGNKVVITMVGTHKDAPGR
jgi:mRNA-degrading endonuclease RelE of RelBE toxin-antitoxin system